MGKVISHGMPGQDFSKTLWGELGSTGQLQVEEVTPFST